MEIKYYDERYYLSRFGTKERRVLEYLKDKNKVDEKVTYICYFFYLTFFKRNI